LSGKLDVAKKMKEREMSNKDISDMTGLTEDEIDML
jgi:predicted transcriptional regulator